MTETVRPGRALGKFRQLIMKIVTADFLVAAEEKKDYPGVGLKEIAFSGRSNVGKSSMINTLLGRRNLVRTSKTPGRTQKLNFFIINRRYVFVDLPGYGFAAVPESVKQRWRPMVEGYLQARRELAAVVTIVDARRPPTASDMQLIDYLQHHEIPFIVAATKADKLSRSETVSCLRSIKTLLGGEAPVVVFSSLSGQGKNELWKEIKNFIE
jgi:GTP-binding protein